jgi:hypothetical protein
MVEAITNVTTHICSAEAPAFGFGISDLGAKFEELYLIDGVANSVPGRREAPGRNLGFNPLGRIWREFDFHAIALFHMLT